MSEKVKRCNCYIGGKPQKNLKVLKENEASVIILYKGHKIKRHREKHFVEIINDS